MPADVDAPSTRQRARPSELSSLTSLRFFAAAVVVLSHLTVLRVSEDALTSDLYKSIFHEGFIGVTFFFILSGFILSHTYAERLHRGMSYRNFMVRRVARIYPLHLLTFFAALPIAVASLLTGQRNSSSFIQELVANLSLVQAFAPAPNIHFSFNAPSWSISCEMFFYFLFPMLVFSKSRWLIGVVVGIYVGQQIVGISSNEDTVHFLVYIFPPSRIADFITGILLYRVFTSIDAPSAKLATVLQLASLAILGVTFILKSFIPEYARYDAYYVPAMSLIILSFAWQQGIPSQRLSTRMLVTLGNASYSLYLVHQVIIRYGEYVRIKVMHASGITSELLFALTYILISLGLSIFLFRFFENKAKAFIVDSLSVRQLNQTR